MKKLYPQFTALPVAAVVFLLMFNQPLFAQPGQSVHEGVIRIKVSEALATRLEQKQFSKTQTGVILTGVSGLDNLNRKYNVKRFTRVFRHAGKNEAKHRKHGLHLWYEVQMNKGSSVSEAVKSYRANQDIQEAEPVYKKSINGSAAAAFGPVIIAPKKTLNTPILPDGANDPLLGSQWHYRNTGQSGGTQGADINVLEAWKIETGNEDIVVAVTDGGIQSDHPDLSANMWRNEDEIAGNNVDDDDNGFVDDIHGYSFITDSGTIIPDDHGTHVGGTIAAVSNNGVGVAGVAGGSGSGDGVRLMSCAVFSDFYAPGGFAESYVYAADNGAVISQNSWGYTFPGVYEQSVLDAIDYFIAEAGTDANGNQTGLMKGGIVIFAAGNSGSEEDYYPGFYDPVLTVAATTHKDIRAEYSNYGAWVDIAAPGGETYERAEEGVFSTLTGSQYGYFMGTSMACPHVSGVAALVLSKYGEPGFRPDALRERLRHSVQNIDALNPAYVGKLGLGRLNAALALGSDDTTPPVAVDDLAITDKDVGQITLTWTSPLDASGFVSAYDLRYSTTPINAENFASATTVRDVPAPQPSGTRETFTVTNLKGGIRYYFALRSSDFEGNVSAISNVVSEIGALTPVISVNAASITENLETAETSTRMLTISNAGEGPLRFTLDDGEAEFFSVNPVEGEILPGGAEAIAVAFDANGLFSGTYSGEITIQNNDPEQNTIVVPVSLHVTNNNAPIAAVEPVELDFISAQTGQTLRRAVTVSNKGSNLLIIDAVTATDNVFGAEFAEDMRIDPFENGLLYLTFSPTTTGFFEAEISLHTNDPVNEILTVQVQGEGLAQAPVTASPAAFDETVEIRGSVVRTLTLQNNGSRDRSFRIEVSDTKALSEKHPTITPAQSDSIAVSRREVIRKHQTAFTTRNADASGLLQPLGRGNPAALTPSRQDGPIATATAEILEYSTDFEEFNVGDISGQEGWFSTQGWTIASENPDSGVKHFRGVSPTPGASETYALSPYLPFEDYNIPRYTSTTMRLNVDNAKGVTWQVVTQDEAFIANRIRFNADGSIESMAIDNEYETYWKKVPIETPSGYFDLAIEYNNWGSDTSGFPTYHLFINNQHVLSGTGLGFGIAQVAIVREPGGIAGPMFDLDDLSIIGDEYNGQFVLPSPVEGTIPAGESVNVSLKFDALTLKFGDYASNMVIHLDETDSLIVPASLTVLGQANMYISPDSYISMEALDMPATAQRTLMNIGGQPIEFRFDYDLPGLVIEPRQGTLAVKENLDVTFTFEGPPGIYEEQVQLHTDMEHRPVEGLFVEITMLSEGSIFVVPENPHFEIRAGEVSTRTIQVRNDGENTVTYTTSLPFGIEWLTLDPTSATIADAPVDIVMTFDARAVSPGLKYSWVNFYTNDVSERYHRMNFTVNVLPDTAGTGKLIREVWTDAPGNTISDIPFAQEPSDSTVLALFESPTNTGDHYGSRIRGYVITPYSGWYMFWIASNDHSELWLSASDNPEEKQMIASVTGYTNPRQWDKYQSQQSQEVYLEGNKKYYIEAVHKEGVGSDHLSVGWQLPGGTLERPIPGLRLAPYEVEDNLGPRVAFIAPTDGQVFTAPATIDIQVDATDRDGTIAKVDFYNGDNKLGTDASAPYTYSWKNVSAGEYVIKIIATDNSGGQDANAVDVVVTPGQSCAAAGHITREQWNGIPGTLISSIPVNTKPSVTQTVTIFESPSNIGDHYGSRIRGFLCVPADGEYIFWIASNDKSELWLSTDSSPANKVKVAYVSGYTNAREWMKYPTQQSAKVQLMAGQKYYIEALHKEGVGTDHMSVGWELPDGTLERPIAGIRLLPFEPADNEPPAITITRPASGQSFTAPATVEISAEASDSDGTIEKVEFYNDTTKLAEDDISPYTYTWSGVMAGAYGLKAVATDDAGAVTSSVVVNINVMSTCTASGTITREYWTGIEGSQVSDIPVSSSPHGSEGLTIFEGPVNAGTHYGARIRGYLCPPATGDYYFWIASNDHSELWLSINEDPANKVRIAFVSGATGIRQWDKYPSQASAAIHLTQGKTYYIEALHKQGVGSDHVAVGWQLPDGTLERPINGTHLSPIGKGANASARSNLRNEIASADPESGAPIIMMYPNPVNGKTLTVSLKHFAAPENTFSDIEIRQLTGLSVYSERIACRNGCSTEVELNERFSPGVYIVQIRIAGKTFTEKLVVH